MIAALIAAILLLALPHGVHAQLEGGAFDIVDLTQALGPDTIFWPAAPPERFELTQLAFGATDAGYFYAANRLCTAEHGGTHLDAPLHFARDGDSTDRIPLTRLVAPAAVIDVSAKAARARDYRLSPDDVRAFEAKHGRIQSGSAVLLRTDWSRYWPDAKSYLGDDTPGDASQLSFPSFGEEAARLLVVERQVAVIGIDTASIDYGRSQDFPVHRLVAKHNVPGLENLTALARLPATGAWLIALPIKIAGGSGGPVRAIALVAKVTVPDGRDSADDERSAHP